MNIDETRRELNVIVDGLLPLSAHNFLDGVPDIKGFDILPEFASFDLGKVKKILDHIVH
jgi:hypothetical protein